MKVPFRQTTLSGCSYFCLANLMGDPRYIHDVDGLTRGQGSFETNERLRQYNPDWYIETAFCLHPGLKSFPAVLTDHGMFELKFEPDMAQRKHLFAIPYIITVKRPNDRNHAILAMHNLKDDWMYVFDSMLTERTECDLEAFVQGYQIVHVETFHSLEIDPEFRDSPIAIDKREFPHLFE